MPTMDLDGMEIHHIDTDKQNNNLENLLPLTKEQHAIIHKYLKKWDKMIQEDTQE